MKLAWSRLSFEDRDRIFDYIAQDNPQAAAALDTRIEAQVMRLVLHPEMGRPGRVAGTRELVIAQTAYIAAYRIERDRIRILRILHSAQLWPEGF